MEDHYDCSDSKRKRMFKKSKLPKYPSDRDISIPKFTEKFLLFNEVWKLFII